MRRFVDSWPNDTPTQSIGLLRAGGFDIGGIAGVNGLAGGSVRRPRIGFVLEGELESFRLETFTEPLLPLDFLRFPLCSPVSGGNFPVETFSHPSYRFRFSLWGFVAFLDASRFGATSAGTHFGFLRTAFAYLRTFLRTALYHW